MFQGRLDIPLEEFFEAPSESNLRLPHRRFHRTRKGDAFSVRLPSRWNAPTAKTIYQRSTIGPLSLKHVKAYFEVWLLWSPDPLYGPRRGRAVTRPIKLAWNHLIWVQRAASSNLSTDRSSKTMECLLVHIVGMDERVTASLEHCHVRSVS